MPTTTARLFFALWPDDVARAAVAAAVAPVLREVTAARSPRREVVAPRPVPAANYHFTVLFLGSVPVTEVERLCSVAAQSATVCVQDISVPISVTLDTLEHWRKPQVLVATSTSAVPAAAVLAEHLTRALVAAGFSTDPKPFRPHLTVARKVTAPLPATPLPPQQLTFEEFALVESRTRPEGSTYSILRTFPLS